MIMTHCLCWSNNLSSKYIKPTLTELQREIGESTVIMRYFNISLAVIDRWSSRPNGSMNQPTVIFHVSGLGWT